MKPPTHTLYQYGLAGAAPDHRAFFRFPPVSLEEMRSWIKDGAGDDAIGLGAVVNEKGMIVGELVMPGGKDAYMVGKDGHAKPVPENYKVTFAQVGHMEPDRRIELDIANKADLQKQIETLLPAADGGAYMVRVHGEFSAIQFRTVETQGKVETLPELLNKENSFTFNYDEKKPYSLVGVYSKKGATEPGVTFDNALHMHGLDNDHQKGGHVNDFAPAHVTVEIMPIQQWLVATRAVAEAKEAVSMSWEDKITNSIPGVNVKNAGHHRR